VRSTFQLRLEIFKLSLKYPTFPQVQADIDPKYHSKLDFFYLKFSDNSFNIYITFKLRAIRMSKSKSLLKPKDDLIIKVLDIYLLDPSTLYVS